MDGENKRLKQTVYAFYGIRKRIYFTAKIPLPKTTENKSSPENSKAVESMEFGDGKKYIHLEFAEP